MTYLAGALIAAILTLTSLVLEAHKILTSDPGYGGAPSPIHEFAHREIHGILLSYWDEEEQIWRFQRDNKKCVLFRKEGKLR